MDVHRMQGVSVLALSAHLHVHTQNPYVIVLTLMRAVLCCFRLLPVVVMPDRDVFSRLLLHRTAVLDHLPSNYVKVLTEMKEAFSSMHLQQ
jgi:hypothetical protein